MFTQKPSILELSKKNNKNEISLVGDFIKDYEKEQFALIEAQYHHCIRCLEIVESYSHVQLMRADSSKLENDASYVPNKLQLKLATDMIYEQLIIKIPKRDMRYTEFTYLEKAWRECSDILADNKPYTELAILSQIKKLISKLDEVKINLLEKFHERKKNVVKDCINQLASCYLHEIKIKMT